MRDQMDVDLFCPSGEGCSGIKTELEGCRALLAALLERSIRDYIGCILGKDSRIKRLEAKKWFYSGRCGQPESVGVTYRWVCEALGWDSDRLLKRIEDLKRQSRRHSYTWRRRRHRG